MTNSIHKQRQSEPYFQEFYRERDRVFSSAMLGDAIAYINVSAQVEYRFLGPKDEQSKTPVVNAWVQQFLRKEEAREAFEKLKESLASMAECGMRPEPTLAERVEQFACLLETDPAAATSTIVDGIADPGTDHPWRRVLVITAEGIGFTDDQDRVLIPSLMTFIETNRDSDDREDQIAVCSAIRTYIGMIGPSQVGSIARLLEPDHRASPALDTVLEILNMIARKFAANPVGVTNQQPELSDQIEHVAGAYLNPYVLPHGKHAAIAMNAVQALVALASPGIDDVIAKVNECCPTWFREQLQRRLKSLQRDWEARLGSEAGNRGFTDLVENVIDRLRSS